MKKTNTKKPTTVQKANASPTDNSKLPNINKNNKSPAEKSKSPKSTKADGKKGKKADNQNNIQTAPNVENKEDTAKKMEELKEKKKKRLEKERKEEERDKKIYEQVVKEFQSNKVKQSPEKNVIKRLTKTTKSNESDLDMNSLNNIQLPQIKISEKKTQAILEESGMLDAYKYLITQLCKNGLPTGNLFEYSALVIKNYEKKWKEKKSKMNKEKLEQYWKEKKNEVENFEKQQKKDADKKLPNTKKLAEEENKMKALNKSIERREINKLIQNMDRSRSSRNHQSFASVKNKSDLKLPPIDDKMKVSVQQKEGKSNKTSPKKGNKQNKSPANATKKNNNEKAKSPAASQKKAASKMKK